MKKAKSIIWGLAIIALGVIFGGNALGLFNINVFFDGWWTLFIIIPSLISLFTEREKFFSLAALAAGIILLLAAQDVFSFEVAGKTILAVVLILVGLGLISKAVFGNKISKEIEKKIEEKVKELEDDKTADSQMAVFSGSDRVYKDEVFSGSHLLAVFGGVDLDIRKAKFDKDAAIKAFCLFGGIDIRVPEDVQVKIKSGFIFGGVSDDRKGDSSKGKYTIYLEAAGGFGGITISDQKKK